MRRIDYERQRDALPGNGQPEGRVSELQALNLDVIRQLNDNEEFSVEDADGKTVLTGTWHPLTPSRFT